MYQAPEVARGERYGFAVDVYSFALTMYELCDRDVPYTKSERGKAFKLAMNVAEKGHRPEIRSSWNPAVSFLITSCWADDPTLRPDMREVMSSLSSILSSKDGIVTAPSAAGGDLHLAPGALWRRVETAPSAILLGDAIGAGAYSQVYECIFDEKYAVCKVFRNTTEESAFKEIELMFALRHPNVVGLYAWFRREGTRTQIGMVIERAAGDLERLYKEKIEGWA